MVPRFQRLEGSSSATDTLKDDRNRSFRLRVTWRLSFSDSAISMRSSSVRNAIMTIYSLNLNRPQRSVAIRRSLIHRDLGLARVPWCNWTPQPFRNNLEQIAVPHATL